MKDTLKQYLEKIGVKDYSELTEVERATYKEWEEVLSLEVKIDDVAKFLEGQVDQLNRELRTATKAGEERLALTLAARLDNYEAIIMFIKEPLQRRQSLERELLNNVS